MAAGSTEPKLVSNVRHSDWGTVGRGVRIVPRFDQDIPGVVLAALDDGFLSEILPVCGLVLEVERAVGPADFALGEDGDVGVGLLVKILDRCEGLLTLELLRLLERLSTLE